MMWTARTSCLSQPGRGAEIASGDPLVVHRVSRAECIEWQLVGIDVDAIEST